ncbi:MAG: insulinase family protein [Gemmatimonadaceae bacterium]|nr:insulinase family protein [Gemmatimonadaceae bacterium]
MRPLMRGTPLVVALLAQLALPPQASLAAQQFPTRPPAALPLEAAPFPPFVEFELGNGLRVVLVPSEKQPVLSFRISVLGGSLYDPAGKSGAADLVAGLLTKGTVARNAEQFAEAIERVGGSISASAGPDFLSVNAAVLAADRELAFDLVSEALLRPTFPTSEIELLRTQTLSALEFARSQPGAIAGRIFAQAVYGDHPYGRRADAASVRAITRDDLLEFHRQRARPTQALLVMAGAIDSTEAHRLAERAFGAWSGRGPSPPPARPAPQRARTEIVLVHRPGSVQSNIIIGNTTWMPTDIRGYALTVANQVLGAAADSRLFQDLREVRGWTYGAYSSVARARGIGTFTATAEVRTEVTDSAVVEMLAHLRRMGNEPVPPEEFSRHLETLVGQFPLEVETAAQVAGQVATARLLGLATDYVQTYRQRLAAVTREQLMATARAGMRADAALVVVVGDGTELRARLEAIAPVTMVDVDGRALSTEAVAAASTTLQFDASRLEARSDSFTVFVQGQPFGFQVSELQRTADGWEFREQSSLGPVIQQRTTVRFDAALTMTSTRQEGRFQGNDLFLEVRYTDGRASGEGVTPGAGQMQSVQYRDVAVPPGTVDDNLLVALLPFVPWQPDASISVSVLATGKGTVERRTFRVLGEEVVTTPLGAFAAFRVSYEGGEAPGTYWIESSGQHRILKFGPTGVPLEFVRER